MKLFIFIVTFLFSNTIYAAPTYDKTVEWLIEKTPVASNYKYKYKNKDTQGKLKKFERTLKLQVVDKKFIFKGKSSWKSDKEWNAYTHTFKLKDLLSVKINSNCPNKPIYKKDCKIQFKTKKRAVIADINFDDGSHIKDYQDFLYISIISSDMAIRIGKAFQHLIDITDSSEPF